MRLRAVAPRTVLLTSAALLSFAVAAAAVEGRLCTQRACDGTGDALDLAGPRSSGDLCSDDSGSSPDATAEGSDDENARLRADYASYLQRAASRTRSRRGTRTGSLDTPPSESQPGSSPLYVSLLSQQLSAPALQSALTEYLSSLRDTQRQRIPVIPETLSAFTRRIGRDRVGTSFVVRDGFLRSAVDLPRLLLECQALYEAKALRVSRAGVFGVVSEVRGDLNVMLSLVAAQLDPRDARLASRPGGLVVKGGSQLFAVMRGLQHLLVDELSPTGTGTVSAVRRALRDPRESAAALSADDRPLLPELTEFMLAVYPGNGTGYAPHTDDQRENADPHRRVLTAVYYVNSDWQPEDGGFLRLYPDAALEGTDARHSHSRFVDVAPVADRLVLFGSAVLPHEVLPCYRDRFAITAWFHA